MTIHGLNAAEQAHASSSGASSSRNAAGDRAVRTEKRPDFNCRMRYNNNLPDVPFEPKFLSYPFDPNRFVQYKPTSLEKSHKWELLTENDLGVHIDLVNPDAYTLNYSADAIVMDPADEKLLEEEQVNTPDSKRSRQHSRAVTWMRKTEYISSEFNRFGTQTERKETKLGINIKKLLKEDTLYKDRDSQIQAIEKTFEDVKNPVHEHYSKPGVVAIQEMPILPDFDLWRYPFAQVIFDADPAPVGEVHDAQTDKMSQALIRGMMDESGEQFVAYFLPTEDTLKKRREDSENDLSYVPDETYDYKLSREYNWTVKNKASKGYEENYFFVFRQDGVYYNELETRVRLSRRRAKEGIPKVANSRLVVTHREQTDQEAKSQNARLYQLQTIPEEDETAAAAAPQTGEEDTAETIQEEQDASKANEDENSEHSEGGASENEAAHSDDEEQQEENSSNGDEEMQSDEESG